MVFPILWSYFTLYNFSPVDLTFRWWLPQEGAAPSGSFCTGLELTDQTTKLKTALKVSLHRICDAVHCSAPYFLV